ncbi:MAG: MXAN_6640 family putative metalloprotease, partial [Candidatus Kapaibacterium sp.]
MLIRYLILPLLLLTTAATVAQVHDDDAYDGPRHARCGTETLMNIRAHGGPRNKFERELLGGLVCSDRSPKQFDQRTSHRHFRIHYDKTGPDAVPSVDLDGNGTPDYIDSTDFYLEYAWDIEVNQYKFDAPPDDHRGTGPEIDVYICDLPEDVYGFAYPEEDNPTDRPNTVNGLLVLDNDYSEALYTTKGIAGIKVTSAHEFNHIIQFSRYKYQYSAEATLYEATAVWFERQVHPTIPDYRQYVRGFLARPDSFAFSTNHVQDAITGYAHVLYLDYLAKRIDRDITRRIWEEFKKHDFVTESVDAALQPSSLNFENSYCEFATWCYYTGSRAQEEKYFPEAQVYPTMRAVTIPPRPLNDETVMQGSLYPLSFGLYQVTATRSGSSIRDTIDFVITNGRTD